MKNETILLRIEPETKEHLIRICKRERRSMTSLILFLIDKKIEEVRTMDENKKARLRLRRRRRTSQQRRNAIGGN